MAGSSGGWEFHYRETRPPAIAARQWFGWPETALPDPLPIRIGTLVVPGVIVIYAIVADVIFRGKATTLSYD